MSGKKAKLAQETNFEEPCVDFVGLVVKPGSRVPIAKLTSDTNRRLASIHITRMSLEPDAPTHVSHTIFAIKDGISFPVGKLWRSIDYCHRTSDEMPVDYVCSASSDLTFWHNGPSNVHLTGYMRFR